MNKYTGAEKEILADLSLEHGPVELVKEIWNRAGRE